MQHDLLTLQTQIQEVLDELWRERKIPFALHVGKLTVKSNYYLIDFHDSRILPASVPFSEPELFKRMVGDAVLARIAQ